MMNFYTSAFAELMINFYISMCLSVSALVSECRKCCTEDSDDSMSKVCLLVREISVVEQAYSIIYIFCLLHGF